ncbi:MAG: KUP/HAK/KT family potassium transporter [Candidatus Eremiobacteraeota bacterium]|nr:KUP/HAK/KT family potassium transporter [Candidatus Eremiobacteraeota bacterium]
MKHLNSHIKDIVKPLGIVFGDIGTSPIYTISALFLFLEPEPYHIRGVLSMIVWSMIIVVYVQYTWLVMNLSIRGEGGIVILREILTPLLKNKRSVRVLTFVTFIGLSFIMGDGVMTPAITILSAVEGLELVPGIGHIPLFVVLLIAMVITFFLFAFQKRGTDKVSRYFSPIMILWFLALAFSGIFSIGRDPSILSALSPFTAIDFIWTHPHISLLLLSEVILAITGTEALYADMGHLGKKSIVKSWHFVFVCLALNYLGQGAHLIQNPQTKSVLFEMILHQAPFFYVPFLLLTVCATIIASQAMISAVFSIVYQGINTNILPRMKVEHTSKELSTQIYIGAANWMLFAAVIFMLLLFKKSGNMALAYGFAINVDMSITAVLLICIYYLKGEKRLAGASCCTAVVILTFLAANIHKVPKGGYWSIIMACFPLLLILLYRAGQVKLYKALRPMALNNFLVRYEEAYKNQSRIKGTGIYLLRDVKNVSPYIANTMFRHNIFYENNIILSIYTKDKPFGLKSYFRDSLGTNLRVFEIHFGYMEVVNIEEVLKEHGIEEKVIFYGIEDISTKSFLWKIFAIIKLLSPAIVQFYNLPPEKLLGVVTRVKI